MQDLPKDPPDERNPTPEELRGLGFLRGLVTVLTATMILGIVALVLLLYTRLPGGTTAPVAVPALPEAIVLPEGAVPQAVTAGPGWWAVVTEAGEILIFDATGTLRQRLAVDLAEPG